MTDSHTKTAWGLTILVGVMLLSSLAQSDPAKPGLAVGQKAPEIKTTDINGKSFDLKREYKKGPVVLIFYRGGW